MESWTFGGHQPCQNSQAWEGQLSKTEGDLEENLLGLGVGKLNEIRIFVRNRRARIGVAVQNRGR